MEADVAAKVTKNKNKLYPYQDLKMPRKCCVTGCNSNYDSVKNKTTTFRLPRDPEERQRWIKAIPRENIPDSYDSSLCKTFSIKLPSY